MKSRYNEIRFDKDNVVAITFDIRPDGLKGFSFQNYETEDELIKPIDKATKADEDREIINLIKHFGYTVAQIAEELKSKYAPDVEIGTYKERIKKRVQRLRNKGLVEEEKTECSPIIVPLKIDSMMTEVSSLLDKTPTAPESKEAVVKPTFNPEVQRFLDKQLAKEKAENDQDLADLLADFEKITLLENKALA